MKKFKHTILTIIFISLLTGLTILIDGYIQFKDMLDILWILPIAIIVDNSRFTDEL